MQRLIVINDELGDFSKEVWDKVIVSEKVLADKRKSVIGIFQTPRTKEYFYQKFLASQQEVRGLNNA